MKILCEFTPAGYSLQRIALEDCPLAYLWRSYIRSFTSFTMSCLKYGGYAKPRFADLILWPSMYEDVVWPPPDTATVKLYMTDDDVSDGTLLFDGTAALDSYDRSGVKYRLKMQEHDHTTTAVLQNDTLVNLFTDYCGATKLDLTLDSTNARSPSPAVYYTPSGDVQTIDLMDGMAAWFTHGFYILDGTLYLYDMLASGTPEALTEFDCQQVTYRAGTPVSLFTSGGRSLAGSNAAGDTFDLATAYHSTAGNIDAALADIKTMVEKPRVELPSKLSQHEVGLFGDFTLTDESTTRDTVSAAKAFAVKYNFDNETKLLDAVGSIS